MSYLRLIFHNLKGEEVEPPIWSCDVPARYDRLKFTTGENEPRYYTVIQVEWVIGDENSATRTVHVSLRHVATPRDLGFGPPQEEA